MVGDESGALRLDGIVELRQLFTASSDLASTSMEHREPLTAPRAEGDDRTDGAEHQEHRLMQQHCHHTGPGERQQRGKDAATGGTAIVELPRRRQGVRRPEGRRPRTTDHDASRIRHHDVRRKRSVSWSCEISPAHGEDAVADLHPCGGRDRHRLRNGDAVDTYGQTSGQLTQYETAGGDVGEHVVRLERRIVAVHRNTGCTADDVSSGREHRGATGVGPGIP